MMEELKPCPFCGVRASEIERLSNEPIFRVMCDNSECGVSFVGHSPEVVTELWNTRALAASEALPSDEEIEKKANELYPETQRDYRDQFIQGMIFMREWLRQGGVK